MERVETFLVELCRRGREGFTRHFPEPMLVVRLAEDELAEFDAVTDPTGPKKSELQALMDLHGDATEALAAVATLRVKRLNAPIGSRLSVGRTIDNFIPLPAKSVSKSHAFVEIREDGVAVTDAGSKNGTTVAGVPLREDETRELTSELAAGASLKFGDVVAVCYSSSAFRDFLVQVFPWADG